MVADILKHSETQASLILALQAQTPFLPGSFLLKVHRSDQTTGNQ